MIKKIGIAGLCMVVLLTGCGMPDAVADELAVVRSSAGFTGDGEEDSVAFAEAVFNGEEKGEKVAVSRTMGERMEKLAAFLEKALKEGVISSTGSDLEEEDEDETEDIDVKDEIGLSDLKDWKSCAHEGEYTSFLGQKSIITVSFAVGQKKIKEFLQGMAGIGFDGLALPNEASGGFSQQVLQGMMFDLDSYDGGFCNILIEIPVFQFAYPEKYKDLLENHMRNAFCVNGIFCGGDIELLSFTGSQNSAANGYIKNAEICFKDGKALQMNLTIQDFSRKNDALFTEEEKADLTGLLTWMTGDAEGSKSFVEGLGENSESSGTLGSRSWYRTKKGMQWTELIRFQ